MKKNWSTILLFIILFIGLSLLLYPTFANWWNSFTQTRVVSDYMEQISKLEKEDYQHIWDAAWEYNQGLIDRPNDYLLSEEQWDEYYQLLNVTGNGIMGYIEVPKIKVSYPLYHGTDAAILQIAIGHLDWTSLPVGGESSHCVVSGHRGLPSARLFTDLDQMEIGDTFELWILDEVLTYEVDQIKIVEPKETDDLLIVEGMDLCTLVTCTPYGINSHRMLVRGHRIETEQEAPVRRVTADAVQIEPIVVTPIVAAPLLLILLISIMLPKPKKYRRPEL
jgi:sortase A